MYERMRAFQILQRAGIYIPGHTEWNEELQRWDFVKTPAKWLGCEGGEHQIIVAGYYYSVDLITRTWRQTA